MDTHMRELLTDIKAAVRLGSVESLWIALEGFANLPEISSNAALPERLISNAVLHLGRAIAHPRIAPESLLPLVDEPLAGLRALAAVALADHWRAGQLTDTTALATLGRDPRAEVREALALTLRAADEAALQPLLAAWADDASPRLQAVAVAASPALASESQRALLEPLHNTKDPDIRAALAEALIQRAASHPEDVFDLLIGWAAQPAPPAWVISQTLSASWAAAYAERALDLLEHLTEDPKAIRRVLRSLARHGAEQQVAVRLDNWAAGDHPALQDIAEKMR